MQMELQRFDLHLGRVRISVLKRRLVGQLQGLPRRAIVMLHGMIAEGETFRKLIQALPEEIPVFAIDMPGTGYSERPDFGDVSLHGMAGMLADALEKLRLDRPIILGHSHGGAVALRFASDYPHRLSGLVLLCPAHPFSHHEDMLVRFYLSKVGRLFARLLPYLPRPLLMLSFRRMPGRRGALGYADIEPYIHTLRGPGTVPHLLCILETWKSGMGSLADDLVRHPLSLPALLLWGDRDIVVPLSTASTLLAHLTAARLTVLPGVGHLPNEEAPYECAGYIRQWLGELEGQTISRALSPLPPNKYKDEPIVPDRDRAEKC